MRSQRELKQRIEQLGKQKQPERGITLRRLLIHARVGPNWERRRLTTGEQDRLDRAFDLIDSGQLRGYQDGSKGCWIKSAPQSRMRPKPTPESRMHVDWASGSLRLK